MGFNWWFILEAVIKIFCIMLAFGFGLAAILTWQERKQSALIHDRIGPNRANILGFTVFGLFHPIADAIKAFTKEDFIPDNANKILFTIGPFMAMTPTLILFAVIPFGPSHYFQISNVGIGILFIFAISSLSIYGSILGGWSSFNKFSLLGTLRTSAQMISYEVTLALNLIGVFMVYQSVELNKIVLEQGDLLLGWLPKWGVVVQPLGFILYLAAAIAESKRAPFDVPEGDSEIIAGYHTEYSSMRFALFFMSEFVQIIVISALAATLFFGGWQIPWLDPKGLAGGWIELLQVLFFLFKVIFFCYLQLLIRWTLPRFRYDQIMDLGWKYLLPLSLGNILITGIVLSLLK